MIKSEEILYTDDGEPYTPIPEEVEE